MKSKKKFGWGKEYRINRSRDFQRIKKYGKKRKTELFDVWYLQEVREHPPVRLAIVVRKKVARAVKRNRIRRLIREYFRLHQHELPGGDYVVIVKKLPEELKYQAVERIFDEEIFPSLKKIG